MFSYYDDNDNYKIASRECGIIFFNYHFNGNQTAKTAFAV